MDKQEVHLGATLFANLNELSLSSRYLPRP